MGCPGYRGIPLCNYKDTPKMRMSLYIIIVGPNYSALKCGHITNQDTFSCPKGICKGEVLLLQ